MENTSILAQLLADQPERTAPGSYLDPAMWGRLNLDSPVTHGLAGALRGLYGMVDFPRQYMQGGIDRGAAVDWAAPMALGMVASPVAPSGAIGSGLARRGRPERIESAAVKLGDNIYTGRTHAHAIEDAASATGGSYDDMMNNVYGLGDFEGFITDTGRYVSREEAAKIAHASGQIRGKRRQLISEEFGR